MLQKTINKNEAKTPQLSDDLVLKAVAEKVKVPVDEVGEFLLRAADYLDKKGLCKHKPWDLEGRMCLIGAMRIANEAYSLDTILIKAWHRVKKLTKIDPPVWNDMPERTKEEVVAIMREAATKS